MEAHENLIAALRQHAEELTADIPLSRDRDAHMRASRQATQAWALVTLAASLPADEPA